MIRRALMQRGGGDEQHEAVNHQRGRQGQAENIRFHGTTFLSGMRNIINSDIANRYDSEITLKAGAKP